MSISDHIFRAIQRHKKKQRDSIPSKSATATAKKPAGARGDEHAAKNVDKEDMFEEKGGFGEGMKMPKTRKQVPY